MLLGDPVVDYIVREHMMEATDWVTRVKAVTALGFVRTARSSQLLVSSYDKENNMRVLLAFSEALANQNSPETRSLLARILEGTGVNEDVRRYATSALLYYRVAELGPLYIKMLDDGNVHVRRNASVIRFSFGRLLLGQLHTALSEAPSRDQRRKIADIIAQKGTRHSIECLESARRTEQDEFVLKAIDKAVIALREKFGDDFDGPKMKRHERKRRKRQKK
jgi:HEAT repeat protein